MSWFVYRQFDADGVLLYVGETGNPKQRQQNHRSSSAWGASIARTELVECENRDAARLLEAETIRSERPLYNSRHNPDGAAARARLAALRGPLLPPARVEPEPNPYGPGKEGAIRRAAPALLALVAEHRERQAAAS